MSSEGHPQQEPVVRARQCAPTAGVRGHCPAEDIPRRPRAMNQDESRTTMLTSETLQLGPAQNFHPLSVLIAFSSAAR